MNFESDILRSSARRAAPLPRTTTDRRVLVATHSHPRLTRGGAEISADALVQGLRRLCGADAWLLGCSRKPQTDRMAVALTQPFGADSFVYQAQDSFDYFKFANRDVKFPEMLRDLLLELRPDVVHFHHYTQFGVEAFATVKRTLPQAKLVLTLHEYLALCQNHGQMVKTRTAQLCSSEGLIDCSACFPKQSPRDFFLRKAYIQKFFAHVDQFVAPSRFLADRYVRWGVDETKMAVLENVLLETATAQGPAAPGTGGLQVVPARRDPDRRTGFLRRRLDDRLPTAKRGRAVRIGFFGQMSPLKGILVLLAAARDLARADVSNIVIDIHGDYSNQPLEFQAAIEAGLKEATANVIFHGPYDNTEVARLMGPVDAVVVPSTWWENAPVVIEEALANRKPVLCSNIGGMAEKVRPGVDGLWFEAGDSRSLADLLTDIAEAPEMLAELTASARKPLAAEAAVRAHLDLYDTLCRRSGPGA